MNPAAEPEILVDVLHNGLGRISFNRPDVANAVHPALMQPAMAI
jgi:enoyl-CoA hydratase/carnithine racemase